MLSENLLQYLADNIPDLTFDKTGTSGNLFDNALPDKPDIAVMLENTGGFPRDMRNTNYKLVSIRFLCRGDLDPRNAKSLAIDVIDTIGTFGGSKFASTSNYKIISCQATQGFPINIGRDENGRHRFSCNFELEIQEV